MKVDTRLAKWTKAEAGPKGDAARDLRNVLEDHLESEIAGKIDAPALAEYQNAKKYYGAAKWAADTLSERVEVRNGANRMFSPSDYGMAMSTLVASGGSALPALAAGLGNKVLRERAYSTAAYLAKKVAGEAVDVSAAPAAATGLARNLQALVGHSEQRVTEGVGRFFGGAAVAAGGAGKAVKVAAKHETLSHALRSADSEAARAAYSQHAADVQMLSASPGVAQERMTRITGTTLPVVAPGLHAAMAGAAGRAAEYLRSHLPSPASDPDSITPQLKTAPPISVGDMHAYSYRLEGVTDPLSLVDDLESGRVAAEKIDAVKNVHPETYEAIRRNIFASLSETQQHVPYEKRMLLDLVLEGGGALEPSLRPESRSAMQQAAEYLQARDAARRQASPSSQNPLAASMRPRSESLAMK
jgi:hypothetical protein